MRTTLPQNGSTRTVTRFLYLPKTLPIGYGSHAFYQRRWWETATIQQRYWGCINQWEDEYWVDPEPAQKSV